MKSDNNHNFPGKTAARNSLAGFDLTQLRSWIFKERELLELALYIATLLAIAFAVRFHLSPGNQDTLDTVVSCLVIVAFALYLMGVVKPFVISRFYRHLIVVGDRVRFLSDAQAEEGTVRTLVTGSSWRHWRMNAHVDVETGDQIRQVPLESITQLIPQSVN